MFRAFSARLMIQSLENSRIQVGSSERVKMLEKQWYRAGCVNPGERDMF
jgi:hypothetical protein